MLDLDPEIGLERARSRTRAEAKLRQDRFEDADLDYHRRIRTAFLARAEAEPDRCVVVPADGSEDEVAELVWQQVRERLGIETPGEGESTADAGADEAAGAGKVADAGGA